MSRITFSVVFFCKRTKLTKKGEAPIYARVTTSGLSTEIYTQYAILTQAALNSFDCDPFRDV